MSDFLGFAPVSAAHGAALPVRLREAAGARSLPRSFTRFVCYHMSLKRPFAVRSRLRCGFAAVIFVKLAVAPSFAPVSGGSPFFDNLPRLESSRCVNVG